MNLVVLEPVLLALQERGYQHIMQMGVHSAPLIHILRWLGLYQAPLVLPVASTLVLMRVPLIALANQDIH